MISQISGGGLGAAIPRIEDLRLLRGEGEYSDDTGLSDQAYAVMVRSPHAHALIRGVECADALRIPGVLAILSGLDAEADGLKPIPHTLWSQHPGDMAFPNIDGSSVVRTAHSVLPTDKVRFAGEAVLMVIGETLAVARNAAEHVYIDYEELRSVTDTGSAARPDAPKVWERLSSNICVDAEIGDRGAADQAFGRARHKMALTTHIQRVTGVPMEPRAALGEYDPATGKYTITSGTGGAFRLKQDVGDVLDVPHDRVRAVVRDVGGNFGTRGGFYPEQALVCWGARRIGRPVKWTSERQECFLSDYQARDVLVEAELALDQDGNFLAVRGRSLSNVGAHTTSYVTLQKSTQIMSGIYHVPVAWFGARAVLSNTSPTRPYRATGRPEAMLVIERLIDLAAAECGFDRLDLRRQNLVSSESMPYRNPFGVVYDNGNYPDALDQAAAIGEWNSFEERRQDAIRRGKLRGIGIGTYVDTGNGVARERSHISVTPDGFVDVTIGTVSNGQGHATTFAQLVHEWLHVSIDRVRLLTGDSDDLPHGGGSHSGRSMRLAAIIIQKAADNILQRGKEIASHLLEAELADLEFVGGCFVVVGTDRGISLFEVAHELACEPEIPADLKGPLAAESDETIVQGTYPCGSHVCELELDPVTGAIEIVRYAAVDDVGRAINPLIVDGQTHGGIAQGIGQALFEHCAYDPEGGQMVAASFQDYAIPRASQLPSYTTKISEVPASSHPLGIRGGGEGGTCPALAVIVNAVADALQKFGVRDIRMPITSESVWQSITHGEGARTRNHL